MPPPLAYFLTWTCHGTWLHGDARGSVDTKHNARFTPLLAPDPARMTQAREKLDAPTSHLTQEEQRIVHDTIVAHCQFRGWKLLAINVRSNHVHVVVTCQANVLPERAMEQFKAWSTRKLREAGLRPHDQRVWTEHGSTRWINTDNSLAAAITYVLERQD